MKDTYSTPRTSRFANGFDLSCTYRKPILRATAWAQTGVTTHQLFTGDRFEQLTDTKIIASITSGPLVAHNIFADREELFYIADEGARA